MSQPWPPGTEPGNPGSADLGIPEISGAEAARVWPDGTHPGMPDSKPPAGKPPVIPPDIPPDKPPVVVPPPVAKFTATPAAPGRNQNVTLDGSGSTPGDAAHPITTYGWTFTDGTAAKTGTPVTWRTPNKAGTCTVTLTVTASDSQAGQASQVFTY